MFLVVVPVLGSLVKRVGNFYRLRKFMGKSTTKEDLLEKNRMIGVLIGAIFSSIGNMEFNRMTRYVKSFDDLSLSLMDDLDKLPDCESINDAKGNLKEIRRFILGNNLAR